MKKNVFTLFLAALFSSISFAQNTSIMKINDDEKTSSKGIRLAFVKPFLDYSGVVTSKDFSLDLSGKYEDANGLSIGYANLPIAELGWTANGTLLELRNDGLSIQLGRVDGNLAYAFNRIFHLKGGLNISKAVKGNNIERLNIGFGFQTSLGFQMTKNFGLEFGYTELHQSGKFSSNDGREDYDTSVKISGLEVGINGTF